MTSDRQAAPTSSPNGIGRLRERSLHAALKERYARPGDEMEVQVDGYVIDIVRDDLLIEVQTGSFSKLGAKLRTLVKTHPVVLIYPIPQLRWIVKIDPDSGERLSRRKSPKRGRYTDLFGELMRIPDLINHPSFSIKVALIEEEQIRCADGRGSWRRKGVSIIDRELVDVIETRGFSEKRDLLALLPDSLPHPFTNKLLARALRVRARQAQRMSYCLKRMGAIVEVGRDGREFLLDIAP